MSKEIKGKFKSTRVDLGEVDISDVKAFSFEWDGDPNEIRSIEKQCGCTDSFMTPGTNIVAGELSISKTITAESLDKFNPSEAMPHLIVSKFVKVHLNDGEAEFTTDEMKRRISNSKHKFIMLTIMARIRKV